MAGVLRRWTGTAWVDVVSVVGGEAVALVDPTEPAGEPEGHLWYDEDDESASEVDAADITSGTVDIARIPTGTTGTTVALGNHTHSAADINAGTLAQARLVPNVCRVLHDGSNYPARPSGVTYVEWVGPTQPTGAVDGDTWVNTA